VCIVLGAHADRLRREVQGLPVLVALNPGWEAGIGSSIRVGLEAVLTASGDVQGVVITLCDQPYVTDRAINRLVEAHRTSGQPIVASRYGGAAGVPALFGRRFFPQLLSLDGSEGAKRLMARNASVVECVAMPEALVDVDTPRDYAALTASEGESKRATHRPPSPNPKFLTAKAP
jgi:molybdenum cofactor cytidylyltransferase